jgi:predicted Zn-dependent peptidase
MSKAPGGDNGNVRESVLANGMRVVTEARMDVRTAAVGIWVDAGARYEAAAENGIAHMLEHMAFKGTARRSALDIAVEIEAVGGHLNAYTSREHTAYFARVMAEDVPLAVDILADILQNSTFAEDELARERTVVLQEIGQSEDTPDDIIFDRLQENAFPDQALGRPILGTVELVSAMTRKQLFDFMANHYGAARMVLSAVGAVDHDLIVSLAEEAFAELGADGGSAQGAVEAARYRGGEAREDRDLEQVHFALGLPGLRFGHDDFYALQVASTLLGGGMSSRLFQELREKRGLCYSIFSFNSSFADSGAFGVYAGTGETEAAELVPVVCEALCNIEGTVTADEVARARAQLKAGTLMALEGSSARAEQLARQLLIYGRPIPLAEIVENIDAVDEKAVERAILGISAGKKPTIAAIGPLSRLASYGKIAAHFVP